MNAALVLNIYLSDTPPHSDARADAVMLSTTCARSFTPASTTSSARRGARATRRPSRCADVVVIGDAPGRTEDLLGRPFVGAAGNLLDNLLGEAGFERDKVYVTTVVKCHPRDEAPDADVVDACSPYLIEQLGHLRPRVIITLGPVATGLILRRRIPLEKVAGFRFDVYDGVTLVPTYHPASVIKGNQTVVASIRRDFMTAKAVLDGRLSTGAEAMAELRARSEHATA